LKKKKKNVPFLLNILLQNLKIKQREINFCLASNPDKENKFLLPFISFVNTLTVHQTPVEEFARKTYKDEQGGLPCW
jgi:hypothetical protein